MQKESVFILRCPRIFKEKRCLGSFESEILSQRKNEIIDGFLNCQRCGAKYPIIQGIPILLDALKEYLKEHFAAISDSIGGAEKIHKDLFAYICALADANFNPALSHRDLSPTYTSTHYFGCFYPKNLRFPLLTQLLKFYRKNSVFEIMEKWSAEVDPKVAKAIDIGCSVGGYTYFLAQRCSFSCGVDLSYPALSEANKIIKNIPFKLDWFQRWEGGKLRKKRIKIKKLKNLDFILASADNLPFEDHFFQLSLLSSVVDIARNKVAVLKETERTLKKRGKVLISFKPFFEKINFRGQKLELNAKNIRHLFKKIAFYDSFYVPSIQLGSNRFSFDPIEICYVLGKKL